MMQDNSYRLSLALALALHLCMLMLFLSEQSETRPVMQASQEQAPMELEAANAKPEEQAIQAVSVNTEEVQETMNRLKAERQAVADAEVSRQKQLKQAADEARRQRLEEQAKIQKMKQEAEALALARKKAIQEEKQRIQELAEKKKQEEQRLAEVKKKQEQEAQKLAELSKKKEQALAQAKQEKAEQLKLAQQRQAKAEQLQKAAEARQAAQERAAGEAARNAQLAGEVNKYKAMIINAIGRQWILPERVDNQLSAQFRIRLAPNGAVMDVSLLRSSGDPILDRSAQAAINKASPLPVPADPTTFNMFRDISLTVRPESARG